MVDRSAPGNEPLSLTRIYRGKPAEASRAMQEDADRLAPIGYVPVSQFYANGRWGCGAWIAACVLILLVGLGLLILAYMALSPPAGTLTVVYELRVTVVPTAQPPLPESVAPAPSPLILPPGATGGGATRVCPACGHWNHRDARRCRACGTPFFAEPSAPVPGVALHLPPGPTPVAATPRASRAGAALVTGVVLLAVAIIATAGYVVLRRPPATSPGLSTGAAASPAPSSSLGGARQEAAPSGPMLVPIAVCASSYGYQANPRPSFPAQASLNPYMGSATGLALYTTTDGSRTDLAPQGWSCSASLGMDGSWTLVVQNPADPSARVAYGGAANEPARILAASLFPKLVTTDCESVLNGPCPTLPPGERITVDTSDIVRFVADPGVDPGLDPELSPSRYSTWGLMGVSSGGGEAVESTSYIMCQLPDSAFDTCFGLLFDAALAAQGLH